MKTLGGIGAAIGTGAAGLVVTADRGSASVTGSLNITDASPVTTDDGEVAYVDVTLDNKITWNGFDRPVAAVAWRDTITVAPNSDNPYTHELYDGRGSPVHLEDFSGKGDSSGWGGDDEWASETLGNYTKASGPTDQGFVHAGIKWRILSADTSKYPAHSVETPGDLDASGIEQPTDGKTNKTTIKYTKELFFYDDSNSYLGSDDGTFKKAPASGSFIVTITNEGATASNTGSGSSTVGT